MKPHIYRFHGWWLIGLEGKSGTTRIARSFEEACAVARWARSRDPVGRMFYEQAVREGWVKP